jgi:hypothetical protein
VNQTDSKAFNVWTSLSLILCNFHKTHSEFIVYAIMAPVI